MTTSREGFFLEIELLSPLLSSGAGADSAVVDRDVYFDRSGLPVLPAKRLKGTLREAWEEVEQFLGSERGAALFGQEGAAADDRGILTFHDARLVDTGLEEWAAWLVAERLVTVNEMLGAHCERRIQTAISADTGGPAEGTLRVSRLVRRGLRFRSRVECARSLDSEERRALSLGAAALKRMGLSRTRGPGEVKCRFLAVSGDGRERDLTREALRDLARDPRPASRGAAQGAARVAPKAMPTGAGVSAPLLTHVLPFRLLLTANAILTGTGGDPNLVETSDWVPGGAMLGALAWRWAREKARDDGFRRIFVEGAVRFLDALPEAPGGPSLARLLPVPHSVRRLKFDSKKGIDLADVRSGDRAAEGPLARLAGRFGRTGGSLETVEVPTELRLHHANSDDRGFGRALGSEVKGGGAFFAYESVCAGQAFRGALLGTGADLHAIRSSCPNGTRIGVGRSIGAEYGGAAIVTWEEPIAIASAVAEWNEWKPVSGGRGDPVPGAGEDLGKTAVRITCLSRLAGVNGNGHAVADLPIEELTALLSVAGAAPVTVTVVRSWTRTGFAGGFRGHLRVPRAQVPCLLAGSVLEVEVEGSIAVGALARLEREGLGLRKEEGFGRVAINRHGWLATDGKDCAGPTDDEEPEDEAMDRKELRLSTIPARTAKPSGPLSKGAVDALRRIYADRVRVTLKARAGIAAEDASQAPTGSLLGRLSRTLAQNDCAAAGRRIQEELGKKLESCEVELPAKTGTVERERQRLSKVLCQVLGNPDEFVKAAVAQELEARTRHLPSDLRTPEGASLQDGIVARLDSERTAKAFATAIVSALSRRRRRLPTGACETQSETSAPEAEVVDGR